MNANECLVAVAKHHLRFSVTAAIPAKSARGRTPAKPAKAGSVVVYSSVDYVAGPFPLDGPMDEVLVRATKAAVAAITKETA